MDEELRMRIDRFVLKVSLLMIAVGVLGELLGWWNDAGLWITGLGSVGTLLTVLDLNGRESVQLLRPMAVTLAGVDAKQDTLLTGQVAVLDGQAKLVDGQAKLVDGQAKLVDGQAKLVDGQTKMVKVQTKMLEGQDRMLAAHEKMINGQGRIIEILDARL